MKRLVYFFTSILIVAFVILGIAFKMNQNGGNTAGNTLTIYNWGDYIDPDLIKKFEKETKIHVSYQTFDSNEAMMTKIEQGGTNFDLIVPSDYTISKMKKANLLEKLDQSKVPNIKYLDKHFVNLSYDEGNHYSIPYFWGTVGILYNSEMLNGMKIKSWKDLYQPELKHEIMLVDGSREVMGMGLNTLGYSLNDVNHQHLQEAKRKLQELMPNVKAIVGDEIKLMIENNESSVGVVWSGEAANIVQENPALDYVIPSEGTNLWFDTMAIPKSAKNKEAAYKFMNFMLDPKNAATNAEYVGYSTPVAAAMKYLPKEVANDKRFYPNLNNTKGLEVYDDLGKKNLSYYNELYLQLKMSKR